MALMPINPLAVLGFVSTSVSLDTLCQIWKVKDTPTYCVCSKINYVDGAQYKGRVCVCNEPHENTYQVLNHA